MERKIGEIFEYNGEWYQCVQGNCEVCDFSRDEHTCLLGVSNCVKCRKNNDCKAVAFKKLEKVGEPFTLTIHVEERLVPMQEYKLYDVNFCKENALLMYVSDYKHKRVAIEIKQNKEDMEQEIEYFGDENTNYSNSEKIGKNLKPFDLQKAKEGKPVCTRDGRKARIICFDRNDFYPIVALIECEDGKEIIGAYSKEGQTEICEIKGTNLMMLPEKKEGWVNVYKRENEYICENECNVFTGITVYKSEGEAKRNIDKNEIYVNTIKIHWEE